MQRAESPAAGPTGDKSTSAADVAGHEAADANTGDGVGSLPGTQAPPQQPVGLADYRPARSSSATIYPFKTRHGEPYFILANRDRGTYLRLTPEEHHVWLQMDGTRTVTDLIYEYYTAFKTLPFDEITQLVAQLRRNYMLADPPEGPAASTQSATAGGWARALSRAVWEAIAGQRTLRIKNIDGLMGELHRHAAWILYTRPFQVLYVILSVVGGALFLRDLFAGRYDLFRAAGSYGVGLLLLIGLNFFTVVIHEASHALTARHYGARVHAAGFMLYFGLPAAFVDTTDVWTKRASARMATTWAGPYSGAILAGLAAIVVQAAPGSWVAPILHRLSFLWLVSLLFNVIPFLELDGYYLAVDWLEIPMLRAQALTFVRRDLWGRLRHRQLLTSRERLLAWFGILSFVFSGLVLAFAIVAWNYRLRALAAPMWAGGLGSKALLVVLLLVLGLPLVVHGVAEARAAVRLVAAWMRRRRVPRGRALDERQALLRQVHCLSSASDEERTEIATHMVHRLFRPGRIVVRGGTPPDHFYVIERGTAEVWVDGDQRPRRRLTRGDYFGETSLLQRLPHSSTIRAGSWLDTFTVASGDFQRWIAPHLCDDVNDRLAALQVLRRFPLFADFTTRELDALAPRLRRERFPAGALVSAEGTPAEGIYLIQAGEAEVLAGGTQRRILRSGDSFGEAALLRHVPLTETVRALTALEVVVLPSSDFESLMVSNPRTVRAAGEDLHDSGLCHSCGPAAASRQAT